MPSDERGSQAGSPSSLAPRVDAAAPRDRTRCAWRHHLSHWPLHASRALTGKTLWEHPLDATVGVLRNGIEAHLITSSSTPPPARRCADFSKPSGGLEPPTLLTIQATGRNPRQRVSPV
jgi:hypothetical protein